MQVWFPEQQRIDQAKWFLWMRIIVGSMSAIIGLWQAWINVHDISRWLGSIATACFLLSFRILQRGESRRVYLANPRAIVTNLSALIMVVTSTLFLLHAAR